MAENNTSNVVENLRKRKQSIDANLSHSEDNIVKKRWISLTDPVEIIDKEGDLYLGLDGGTLKVSRKALSLSSRVFLAMLGAHSRFAESNQQSFHADGVQFISFSDDDFESMEIVARIIHLQFDQVPDSLLFSQLYHIAVLCDKYDLKRCLGMYPDLWSKPYLNSYRLEGYEGWLFMSIVFRYDGLFKEVTRHLRLNAQVTGGGALALNQNYDLGNGISSTIIERIIQSRNDTMFAVQDLYWQEIHKLRDSGTTRVCKVGGGKHTLCDAINLGSFLQVLPGLYDPRDIQGPVKIAVSVLVGAGSKMLDGTASILYRFGDHRSCSVGPRLVAAAKQLSDAVEGLELNK